MSNILAKLKPTLIYAIKRDLQAFEVSLISMAKTSCGIGSPMLAHALLDLSRSVHAVIEYHLK